MLNRMITTSVKAACPAAKEIIDGAMPGDQHRHRQQDPQQDRYGRPTPIMMTDPTTKPTAVPPTARRRSLPCRGRWSATPTWSRAPPRSRAGRRSPPPPPPRGPGRPHPARRCGTRPSGTRSANEPAREDLRSGLVRHPQAAVDHRLGPGRLQRRIGHHLRGDTESPGVEARIERARDALARGELGSDGRVRRGLRVGQRPRRPRAPRRSAVEPLGATPARLRCAPGRGPGAPRRHRSARAIWWSVSATFSVTARAGRGSVDQCSSRIIAVLPATHSTRPTSLESATALAAAPVGG